MYKKIIILLIIFSNILLSAQEKQKSWDIEGFGTFGGSFQNDDTAIFRTSLDSQKGSKDDFSFATDSKIGLQYYNNLTNKLSFMVQGISKNFSKEGGVSKIEWANLKYNLNKNSNIRIGRLKVPLYMYSDIQNVTYAYTWLRLPLEIYSALPFSGIDGIESYNQFTLKDHSIIIQMSYGKNKESILKEQSNTTLELENIKSISIKDYVGDFQFKISYFDTYATVTDDTFKTLFNTMRTYSLNDLADDYDINRKKLSFFNLSFSYFGNDNFVVSEFIELKSNSVLGDGRSGYISAGHTFGKFTPYITIANMKNYEYKSKYDLPNTSAALILLNTNIKAVKRALAVIQESKSIGFRYELSNTAAFKFQYDRIKTKEGYNNLHTTNANYKERKINVFSATLDFLF